MNVKISTDKPQRKITAMIYGDLDHHTAKYIRSDIDAAIHDSNPQTLVIDFSNVTFMDSSGIGLVMGRYKIMNELSGRVFIADPPVYIRKVMQLAGLHKLCKIITSDIKDTDESNSDEKPKEATVENENTTIPEGQNA